MITYCSQGAYRGPKEENKSIIGVITTCATCTLINMMFHRICRVCIIGPTVIVWAYQLVGMLPVSMCYAGGPCGTLKCALPTTIAMPNRSANFILLVHLFYHAFCMVRGLDWHLGFYAHARRSGDYLLAWILRSIMCWCWRWSS